MEQQSKQKQLQQSQNDLSQYYEMLQRLRKESFNTTTNTKLMNHPYLLATQQGTLTIQQRQAFAGEQYHIQYTDACTFGFLAGHSNFPPPEPLSSITEVPKSPLINNDDDNNNNENDKDLFQFLLEGEIYASKLLLDYAKSVGLQHENELKQYPITSKAQGYPSYWSRLAHTNTKGRGIGAAACAVNFPTWGNMCRELSKALKSHDANHDDHQQSFAFIDFFGTPIDNLDDMAVRIMKQDGVTYDEIVTSVRLLQEYEILFWDAIYEAS